MDVTTYNNLKSKGTVSLIKINDTVYTSVKKFDTDTGEALPSVVTAVDTDGLKQQIVDLQSKIDQINILISDVDAVK